jgi:two-component system, OmpR family, KDP operon response regulator KdpE
MVSHTDASVAYKAMQRSSPLVLVVDDERPMQELLRTVLRGSGLDTLEATSGAEALAYAATESPDIVLMDLGLPDEDGIDVTRRLREWMAAPILVISARWQERDKVAVLDAGANDYVTKPFANAELLARVRVWLRQTVRASRVESTITVGELRIDLDRRLVHAAGREVHLTPIEYSLFATLMQSAGRIVTYRQLLEATWGPRCASKIHYLRVYVAQLRRKLEPDGGLSRYFLTEPGVGYRLRALSAEKAD